MIDIIDDGPYHILQLKSQVEVMRVMEFTRIDRAVEYYRHNFGPRPMGQGWSTADNFVLVDNEAAAGLQSLARANDQAWRTERPDDWKNGMRLLDEYRSPAGRHSRLHD